MKSKSIIFFDGDGTLWYPKSTKRSVPPHWIYADPAIGDKYLNHIVLTPSTLASLKKLKKHGVKLVVLSTHPHSKAEADKILSNKIRHFKLTGIFDAVYSSRNYPEGKGEKIVAILKKMKIPKAKALMIGDNYNWDYMSAKRVGVDALLIKSDYVQKPRTKKVLIDSIEAILSRYTLSGL